jgi:uncharacterized membrane protein
MHLDDNKMETIMGRLLQVGVLAAGLLMFAGGVWYLKLHGFEKPHYGTFHRAAPEAGVKLLWAAVIVMIATPVLRVAFAVVAFAIERDWLYTAISLIVLALLGYSLLA